MKKIFNTKTLSVFTALLMVLTAVLPMGTSAAAMTDEEIREHLGLLMWPLHQFFQPWSSRYRRYPAHGPRQSERYQP